jgi:hypothetical protein
MNSTHVLATLSYLLILIVWQIRHLRRGSMA